MPRARGSDRDGASGKPPIRWGRSSRGLINRPYHGPFYASSRGHDDSSNCVSCYCARLLRDTKPEQLNPLLRSLFVFIVFIASGKGRGIISRGSGFNEREQQNIRIRQRTVGLKKFLWDIETVIKISIV